MWKYKGLKGEDIFRKCSERFFILRHINVCGHLAVDCVPVWMHVWLYKWLAAKRMFS